jgi:hypothetical protein
LLCLSQVREWLVSKRDVPGVDWVHEDNKLACLMYNRFKPEFKAGWATRLLAGNVEASDADAGEVFAMFDAAVTELRKNAPSVDGVPLMVVPTAEASPESAHATSAKRKPSGQTRAERSAARQAKKVRAGDGDPS